MDLCVAFLCIIGKEGIEIGHFTLIVLTVLLATRGGKAVFGDDEKLSDLRRVSLILYLLD